MKQSEDVRMDIEQFILDRVLDTLLHKVESHGTLERFWFIYTRNKGMSYVRIAPKSQLTSQD